MVGLWLCFPSGRAESVYVKYRGEVDLRSFDCKETTRSSFINRICYDRRNEYMLISLNGTYYHYCEIDPSTVSSLLDAPSVGQFYNANIKGQFDCRVHRVPEYSPAGASEGTRKPTVGALPDASGTNLISQDRARPSMAQTTNGSFDGRWSATVGPQGACRFTSTLILDVVGSSIVGNATNPSGVFPLSGTVNPSGTGVFKIGGFVGTVRFTGTTFQANYANACGGRFAIGTKRAALP
jgi:hypothetical protein